MFSVDLLADGTQCKLSLQSTFSDRLETFPGSYPDDPRDRDFYRLVGYAVEGDVLHLKTERTNYTQFRRTRDLPVSPDERWTRLANPLSVCAVCRSSDGFLLVEKRGNDVELYRGAFHVVGGYTEVGEDRRQLANGDWTPDFHVAILREIAEELNHVPVLNESLRCNGLVFDRHAGHPELCFSVDLAVTLARAAASAKESPEFHDMHPIADQPQALHDFLSQPNLPIVPAGWHALRLYGKSRFGADWDVANA